MSWSYFHKNSQKSIIYKQWITKRGKLRVILMSFNVHFSVSFPKTLQISPNLQCCIKWETVRRHRAYWNSHLNYHVISHKHINVVDGDGYEHIFLSKNLWEKCAIFQRFQQQQFNNMRYFWIHYSPLKTELGT